MISFFLLAATCRAVCAGDSGIYFSPNFCHLSVGTRGIVSADASFIGRTGRNGDDFQYVELPNSRDDRRIILREIQQKCTAHDAVVFSLGTVAPPPPLEKSSVNSLLPCDGRVREEYPQLVDSLPQNVHEFDIVRPSHGHPIPTVPL